MGTSREKSLASAISRRSKDSKPSGFAAFLRIFSFARPIDHVYEFVSLVGAVGAGVAVALVNLVLGDLLNLISDYTTGAMSPSDFRTEAGKLSLYFVYIGIAKLVLTYIYSSLSTYAAYNITRNIRHAYFRSALSQEIVFFDCGGSGSIPMQAISNGKMIQSGIAEKLGLAVQAIATFFAAFIIAFISYWKLTLIIICIAPAIVIVIGTVAAIEGGVETKILQVYASSAAFAETALRNIRAINAFSLRPSIVSKYEGFLAKAKESGDRKSALYGIMFGGQNFIVFSGMGLAFWQGIGMIVSSEVQGIGTVFTVLFSVVIASTSVTAVAPHTVAFNRAAKAASELFELIDRKSEVNPFSTSGDKPSDIVGTIRLENINFSYPSRPDVRVLENLSLNVPTGKVTALVGASGSGKSTIVGLLERWYSPQAGTITLDGQPLDQLNLTWLRTNIRLVQQEPVIFSGTVFENIANGLMGSRFANNPIEDQRERVQEAAKEAFAHDFIMGLPHGYDTPVGERGGLLSGGQKQRIAIARSIVSKPKILLLDEATSALDPQAEGIVQKALDSASRDRTTIVIAHKLATICNADNIVVMSKGQVIEQGHHAELIEKNGQYANLVKAQDLSVMANEVDPDQTIHDDGSSQHGELAHTLTKNHTEDERHFEYLKDKDDFDLVPLTGLVHTICRLIQATPELRGWYALAVLACFASAAVYPGQVLLIASVMGLFTGPDVLDRGNFVALMFFVMGIGAFIGNFAMGWIANVIAQTLSYRCRKEILDDVLRQDLQFFDRPENTVGALTSRLDSYPQAVFELMGFNISLMLIAMVNIISCSILSIATSWKLGLVGVFAGLPPMLLAGYARIRVETKMDRDTDRRFSASASVASESVAAIRTISSLAIEETILQKYTEELDRAIRLSTGPLFQIMVWFSFTQSVEAFILALGFWWGCRLVSFDDISFYQFVVAFMGIYFCGQGGAQLFSHSSSFTKANSAANYYFWLRNLQPLVRETDNNVNQEAKDTCSSFDFKNVKFCYPLAPKVHVLQGVNIKIDRGQFVAFVGASGCGKSTIISLLERFYDPTSGTISTDGARLQDINPRLYRDNIALVQQEPTLFPGSIKDNIAMGLRAEERDSPNDDSIEAACRAANIWDFICSLPEGLDTLCGMGGSQLSGGQRQRIAIARALIRNPRVLLLDEATSALDTESEKLVQEALMSAASSSGRITIAVAHRLSTIRDADCIYVFQDGRIIDAGTHSELIGRGGLYKKMFEAQSLDQAA